MAIRSSRYLVGIDLGTTHTVVAFADTHGATTEAPPEVQRFAIPQLVSPGEIARRKSLPSAAYLSVEGEFAAHDGRMPWHSVDEAAPPIVGELALKLGERTPGRLVASAKSWLSHSAVDRTAKILPWGGSEGQQKISPVDASELYLAHLREAWDADFPNAPLAEQEVILTVPASFDEGARALTLEAAKRAGLRVRLVEEPQAAFYAWLDVHRSDVAGALGKARLAVVVDVGGGTTDLTLIRVELRESGPRLTRIAVGEHLMLGGDNMDVALARKLEAEGGKTLNATKFSELVQRCRRAKERLLGEDAPEKETVTLLGSGSRLIGAAKSHALLRDDVQTLALDGFFPKIDVDAEVQRRGAGIVEFGLPYASDPAITRHLAEFLRRHEDTIRDALSTEDLRGTLDGGTLLPDALLLNGGVFQSEQLSTRVADVLGDWLGRPVVRLDGDTPSEAVARGAVAYGLGRRGLGLKIGGGSARSYFLLLGKEDGKERAVCLLPKGSEEGEEVPLKKRSFSLKVGRPVRFHLAATTSGVAHIGPGDIIEMDDAERYKALPPIAAVIELETTKPEVPVSLAANLTEIGTLEMSCIHEARRWKLEFQLRQGKSEKEEAHRVAQLHPRFKEAGTRVSEAYGKSKQKGEVKPKTVKRLRPDLEKLLGARDTWNTPLLRELFGELLAGAKRRRRSPDHERVWFNLVGYTMRPGYGFPLDAWRAEQVTKQVLNGSIQFVGEAQNCTEYWTMWRRIAGGLDAKAQKQLLSQIEWYLHPPTRTPRKRPKGPKLLGYEAMVRLAGALERVSVEEKAKIGGWLVERLDKHDEAPDTWWAVGRIGARVPMYGSAHEVVPKHVATQWLQVALTFDWKDAPQAALAATLLSRKSGDRQRDVSEETQREVLARLKDAEAPESWSTLVREVTELDASAQKQIFGDALPPGLRLLD